MVWVIAFCSPVAELNRWLGTQKRSGVDRSAQKRQVHIKSPRIHLHTPPNPTCSRWYDHEWLKADYKPDSPHPPGPMRSYNSVSFWSFVIKRGRYIVGYRQLNLWNVWGYSHLVITDIAFQWQVKNVVYNNITYSGFEATSNYHVTHCLPRHDQWRAARIPSLRWKLKPANVNDNGDWSKEKEVTKNVPDLYDIPLATLSQGLSCYNPKSLPSGVSAYTGFTTH